MQITVTGNCLDKRQHVLYAFKGAKIDAAKFERKIKIHRFYMEDGFAWKMSAKLNKIRHRPYKVRIGVVSPLEKPVKKA